MRRGCAVAYHTVPRARSWVTLRRVDDARPKQFRDAFGGIAEEVAEHGARVLADAIGGGAPGTERLAIGAGRAGGHPSRAAPRGWDRGEAMPLRQGDLRGHPGP